MKYLISVSSLTPGSGLTRYVFSLCRILIEQGNDVYVLTTHNTAKTDYEEAELNNISPKIKLCSLGQRFKLLKYLDVIRYIRRLKPDIIINNYNGVVQFVLPFVGKNVQNVHILHNDTDDFYRIASINEKRVDGWIAPTKAIADHFNAYTNNRFVGKVEVISHGVESNELIERNNKVLEIVYAGVLYEHKGVRILPAIIKKLISDGVDLHFTVIGNGILADWLEEMFNKEIHSGRVTMTGVIDHGAVYDLMSKADIFLYPTHLDAFGLVIAEAMMNGSVPIVSYLPGITDNLVDDGMNGFLLNKDDVNGFVNIIKVLDRNKGKLKQMSVASHDKALEKFSLSRMSQNYANYFSRFDLK